MVIVDSNVWIHWLRTPDTDVGREVMRLLDNQQAAMVGVVLAEVLQGARGEPEFNRLRTLLAALPYVETTKGTWLRAGELAMQLRGQGRLIPLTDLVIASLAMQDGHEVFSLDEHFQRVPGLMLYEV
ncbi:MAG: PIN domain-containing protein [Chloroflexi bacterium]|nr:PIN domain-containing protein [Chloroflexota bacterium]